MSAWSCTALVGVPELRAIVKTAGRSFGRGCWDREGFAARVCTDGCSLVSPWCRGTGRGTAGWADHAAVEPRSWRARFDRHPAHLDAVVGAAAARQQDRPAA